MKPLGVVLLITGTLIGLVGLALMAAGAGLGWALATQRDDTGFFTTPEERFETDRYAITSDRIELGDPGPDDWWADRDLASVKVVADSAGDGAMFIGIGSENEVENYLAGVPHDEITDVNFDPFEPTYSGQHVGGRATPEPPTRQSFWVAQDSGVGTLSMVWDLEPGNWAIVMMNADGSDGVVADVEIGARIDFRLPIPSGCQGVWFW